MARFTLDSSARFAPRLAPKKRVNAPLLWSFRPKLEVAAANKKLRIVEGDTQASVKEISLPEMWRCSIVAPLAAGSRLLTGCVVNTEARIRQPRERRYLMKRWIAKAFEFIDSAEG
jgi:hypothetical protein